MTSFLYTISRVNILQVFLEKLMVLKFPVLGEGSLPCSQKSIIRACLEWVQSTPHFLRPVLILHFHLCLCLRRGLFYWVFLTKIFYLFIIFPMNTTCPVYHIHLTVPSRKFNYEGPPHGVSCNVVLTVKLPVLDFFGEKWTWTLNWRKLKWTKFKTEMISLALLKVNGKWGTTLNQGFHCIRN